MSYRKNVSMINDLMDIDDNLMENENVSMLPFNTEMNERDIIQKKAGMKLKSGKLKDNPFYQSGNDNSGFSSYPYPNSNVNSYEDEQIGFDRDNALDFSVPVKPLRNRRRGLYPQPDFSSSLSMSSIPVVPSELSCIQVCEHVNNCPVCSKIFNNDKTIYIILIILLSITTLICLKKVLNV